MAASDILVGFTGPD